jgi:VWFA-related protein
MTGIQGMILLAILCAPAARAQQQPAPSAAAAPLLYLDVEVVDRSGHPVPGLEAGDFTVLDNRAPSAVQSFAALASSDTQAGSIALVLDDADSDFMSAEDRSQILAFLRNSGKFPMPVSIYLLTQTRVSQIIEPSTDGNQLAKQFQDWSGHLPQIPWSADWGLMELYQNGVDALDKLTSWLSVQPARKLLIFLSPGWPIFNAGDFVSSDKQQKWTMNAIVKFSSRLRDDDITVDVVDSEGIQGFAGITASTWQSQLKPVKKWQQANLGNLALQVIAVQSGGQVYIHGNDLAGGITRCIQDSAAWYTLGIARQKAAGPDEWHGLEIKTNKPDVVVRTRNGYYAEP